MKKTGVSIVLLATVLAVAAVFRPDCRAQFTQGPPDNPSAAGITAGSPAPTPAAPHVIDAGPAQPPPSGRQTFSVPGPSPERDILTAGRLLELFGIPPLVDGPASDPLARRLALSGEQIRQMDAVRDRFYRQTRELRYEILNRRLELRKLFLDPGTNPAVIGEKARTVASLWNRLAGMSADAAIEARGILTGEQVERLERLIE